MCRLYPYPCYTKGGRYIYKYTTWCIGLLFFRKRQGGIELQDDVQNGEHGADDKTADCDDYNKKLVQQINEEKVVKKEVVQKKKDDSLWADFLKDVGGPKPKSDASSNKKAGSTKVEIITCGFNFLLYYFTYKTV